MRPLSAKDPGDLEKLMAYVWADQTARLARLKAALEIAQTDPPNLDRGDAAGWVENALAIEPAQRRACAGTSPALARRPPERALSPGFATKPTRNSAAR